MGTGEQGVVFSFSLWGNHVVRKKLILAAKSLPKLLQGKKKVDGPIDGPYQGQSNSLATTKDNDGVTTRHQGLWRRE